MTVFPFPLGFLWVICFTIVSREVESFYLAFLTGLFSDFLKGEYFGKTALVFLIFSLLIALYKRKFKVLHPLYFFPFVSGAVLVFNFWEFGEVEVFRVFLSLLWAVVLFKIAQALQREGNLKLNL